MTYSSTHRFPKYLKNILAGLFFSALAGGLSAQLTCPYTLELADEFGDTWFGGELTVTSSGIEQVFTIDNFDVFFESHTFLVTEGEPIVLTWTTGFFLGGDESITLLDSEGNEVFSIDALFDGELYNDVGTCPSCLQPIEVFMSDVNATNAELGWRAFDGYAGDFRVEYDTFGFALGEGQMLSVPHPMERAPLTGLEENSTYEAYVFLDCGPDSSSLIGPIEFHTLWLNDIGVTSITAPTDESCTLGPDEIVTIEMTNFGQTPQTLFEFYFSVNGQAASIPVPQDGLFTGVIGNDSTQSISFETTWDFSVPDFYVIEAWTQLEGDSMPANDTFRIEVATAFQKPIMEDFEEGVLPTDWTSPQTFLSPPMAHGNETWVWGANIWAFNTMSSLTTETIGPVVMGDSLIFDYRYVNFGFPNNAALLGPGDMLEVQISDDCGETFETVFTIDQSNHDSTTALTTIGLPLDDYDGMAIVVQFVGTWGTGDYWLDLDNINVTGCPVTFGVLADIIGTEPDTTTGQITVSPSFGTEPFTYEWDNGGDSETITDLGVGTYTVTITDANGCSTEKTYQLGTLVSAEEVAGVEQIMLFPNPTSGLATLDVSLAEAMDLRVRAFNMAGQIIFEKENSMATHVRENIDLSDQPEGLYILQIIANGRPYFAKIMVAR